MMGFLNKFMDALGVELEQGVVDEVADTMGGDWSPGRAGADLDPTIAPPARPHGDGWRIRLGLVPLLPGAIRFDRRVQRGMPSKAAAIAGVLRDTVGHDFPVLASARSDRARRAIASMLRENLDPTASVIGLEAKLAMRSGLRLCGQRPLAPRRPSSRRSACRGRPRRGCARQRHHRPRWAASPSPAEVDAATILACEESGLSAASVIEVITWLAVLQLLHRLMCWVNPTGAGAVHLER